MTQILDPVNNKQIGGDHYRRDRKYETWDVILDWGLGYLDGCALKYLSRWRRKHPTPQGRIADLEKARHYIEKQIAIEREALHYSPQAATAPGVLEGLAEHFRRAPK